MTGKNIGELLGFMHCAGKRPCCRDDQMNFTVVKSKSRPEHSIKITFGSDLIKQMRWVGGDRISLNIDPVKSEGAFFRVPAGSKVPSWSLTARKPTRNGVAIGELRGHIQISIRPKLLDILGIEGMDSYIPAIVVTGPDGITFPLGKQWKVSSRS